MIEATAVEAGILAGMKIAELIAEQFGLDKAVVLRFAAEELPALLPSPPDESGPYHADRDEVLSRSER